MLMRTGTAIAIVLSIAFLFVAVAAKEFLPDQSSSASTVSTQAVDSSMASLRGSLGEGPLATEPSGSTAYRYDDDRDDEWDDDHGDHDDDDDHEEHEDEHDDD